ncbi:MAG: hypothetical protein ACLQDY_22615 [Streptosporangiaceae bacterium]
MSTSRAVCGSCAQATEQAVAPGPKPANQMPSTSSFHREPADRVEPDVMPLSHLPGNVADHVPLERLSADIPRLAVPVEPLAASGEELQHGPRQCALAGLGQVHVG